MTEPSVVLTASEREFLVDILTTVLKDSLVEEHRTRTPSFRKHILERGGLIAGLLQKLGVPKD
jgi:hypothetical protein